MNTLATIKKEELTNKELRKSITAIEKALKTANKSSWDYAKAVSEIVLNETFKDDFKNLATFAKAIDSSAGNISKLTNAYELARITKTCREDYATNSTISQWIELLPLGDGASEFALNNITFEESTREIRKMVHDFLKADEEAEVEADVEADVETNTEAEELDSFTMWLVSCPYSLTDEQMKKIEEIAKND